MREISKMMMSIQPQVLSLKAWNLSVALSRNSSQQEVSSSSSLSSYSEATYSVSCNFCR